MLKMKAIQGVLERLKGRRATRVRDAGSDDGSLEAE
jgi:hypothetical protein